MERFALLNLFILSFFMMTGTSSAETFLSVPSDVAEEENATIVVENSDVEKFNVSLNVSGTEATYSDIFSASEGTASKTIDLSSENLTQGKYSVSASVFNESINFSDSSISGFKVLSGITGAKMVDLTSMDISETDCPLNKSKSMNDECKLFGVNVTVDESSNLSELSESGEPLTASLNGGQNHVGLVDTESQGEYDTVFWDDDPVFRELNETGANERSFVSPGEPVKNFRIGNKTAQLNTIISGDDLVFSVPPTSDEVPFRQSDSITYAFLGYGEADKVLGSAVDVTPVEGIDMKAVSRKLGDQNTKTLQTSNSTTNRYGFTGIGNIQSANVGRHKVSINNVSSEYYEVKSFSVNYRILDPSTGTRDRVFRPGETVKVEAVPTLNGEEISYDSIQIELTDSSGQRFKKTLDQSNSAIFNISEDTSGGRASVSINVESGGVTQTESTSFEIKKFKVYTIPLRSTNDTANSVDSFAPGSTGYVLVNAVQLGTFGEVGGITDAFYDIDNSSTEKDECKQNVGRIEGQLNGIDALDTVNKTNFNDSSIFPEEAKEKIPQGFNTQCVVKFDVKDNISGFFSGDISVKRLGSNETQKGSISFGVSRFKMSGSSVDAVTGDFEYEFGSNERVGIKPEVRRIEDYSPVNDSRIVDASVLDIEGDSDATVRNATFNASGNSLLSFESPDSSGDYRLRFTATVNTTDSPSETRTVTGTGYFDVEVFEVEEEIVQPDTSYRVPPQSNVSVEVKVTEPGSDNDKGIEGLGVNLTELENGQQETNYLDDITVNAESTDENGIATLELLPENSWGDGYYTGEIEVSSPSGESETAFLYFRVDKYEVEIDQELNGEPFARFGDSGIISGDNLQFFPKVYKNSGRVSADGEIVDSDINLEESSLIYYGNGVRYSTEELDIEDKAEVSATNGTQSLNLSTENLSSGSYRLNLDLDLSNSDSVSESSYFDLNAFEVNVTNSNTQQAFQPGSNVTYYVNTSKKANYTLRVENLESYDYRSQDTREIEGTTKRFSQTSSMALNISIPDDAKEGFYNGYIEISSGDATQYEDIDLEVETKGIAMPKTETLQYHREFARLEPENKTFYEDKTTYFSSDRDCSDLLSSSNLEFKSGNLSEESCSLALEDEDFNVMWVDNSRTGSWNDSSVYITTDSTFNETGDVAVNKSLYETVTFSNGLRSNISEIIDDELKLTPLNGFSNRETTVLVERTADSYFFGDFSSTVEESGYSSERDINGDGDTNDTLKALLVNESGTLSTRVSFNNNFTAENSTVIDKSPSDLGGKVVYGGEIRNNTRGFARNLIFPSEAEFSNIDATIPDGSNFTFPVIASYPNGTPVKDQQVGISKIIRDSSRSTSSKVFNTSSASATTDDNGIAFIDTSLPALGPRATSTYRVIPTTLGENRKPIDRFDAPKVTVSKLRKISNTYSRIEIGQMTAYSNESEANNTENLEQNEDINLLTDEYSSSEYRFTEATEFVGSDCYDIVDNRECDTNISVLMYDDRFSDVQGMRVNEVVIDDDTRLGEEEFDNETGGYESSIYSDLLFANYSSIRFTGNDLRYADLFGVFNESNDRLAMFKNEIHADDNIYLGLRGTELFTDVPLSGEATVDTVSYDGDVYNATETISKSLDQGFVLFNLSRSDFSGSDSSWEEGIPISFSGNINGTTYTQRLEIEETAQEPSSDSGGSQGVIQ